MLPLRQAFELTAEQARRHTIDGIPGLQKLDPDGDIERGGGKYLLVDDVYNTRIDLVV